MPYTEAGKRATMKYQKANFDQINVRFPKGQREIISAHAEKMGEPMSAFIMRAIKETMARDAEKAKEE